MTAGIDVGHAALARVAAWPLETLEPLRSPGLCDAVATWARNRDAVMATATALAERVGFVVPRASTTADRGRLLQLRRALHRDWRAIPDAAAVGPLLADLDPDLAREVDEHLGDRLVLAAARADLDDAHGLAAEAEWSALAAIADAPAFGRALVLGAPELAARVARDRAEGAPSTRSRVRRRRQALLGHVFRAVGRPTPAGLWAGVLPVVDGDGEGIRARPAPAAVNVTVDPEVMVEVLVAWGLDTPVLVPGDDPWAEPWAALGKAGDALSPDRRGRWRHAIGALRAAANELATVVLDGDAPLVDRRRRALEDRVDAVRAEAGLAACPPGSAVRVDLRLPWELTWDGATRAAVGEAVRRVERLHAVDGGAELWRSATVAPLVGPERSLVTVAADVSPDVTVADPRSDRVRVFGRFGATVAAAARAVADRWAGVIEPAAGERTLDLLDVDALALVWHGAVEPAGPGLGPVGSIVLEPTTAGVRVVAPRPAPLPHVARFAALVPAPVSQARRWLREWEDDGVVAADVVAADARNPGAALVPRVSSLVVDAAAPDGWSLWTDEMGRAWFRRAGTDLPVLALVHHAAVIGSRDPISATLRAAASVHGWELPATVFPLLPAERERWHHLPRLSLGSGLVVSPERWVLDRADLDPVLDAPDGPERFVRWRALCERLGLPATVTARRSGSPNEPGSLVPTDSVLGVGAFLDGIEPADVQFVLDEGPHPGDGLHLPGSGRHLVQVVAAWREPAHWQRCPPPPLPSPWLQWNLSFPVDHARGPAVPWAVLAAAVEGWEQDGLVESWFFVRKPPGMRVRLLPTSASGDPRRVAAVVAERFAAMAADADSGVITARRGVYEPETTRFGGAEGLSLLHRWVGACGGAVLPLETAGLPAGLRYPLAALGARAFVGAALADGDDEDGAHGINAVWSRLAATVGDADADADVVADVEPDPATREALADPDAFMARAGASFSGPARRLLEQAVSCGVASRRALSEGRIDAADHRWCADVVLFGWNVFGLGLDRGATASMLAALRAP